MGWNTARAVSAANSGAGFVAGCATGLRAPAGRALFGALFALDKVGGISSLLSAAYPQQHSFDAARVREVPRKLWPDRRPVEVTIPGKLRFEQRCGILRLLRRAQHQITPRCYMTMH